MVRTICTLMTVVMLNDPVQAPGWQGGQTVRTAAGTAVRIGAFAVFRADCSVGPSPDIRLQRPPRDGVVDFPAATMTTSRLPNCPRLSAPAQQVVYRPNAGFIGIDAVTFEVVNAGSRQIESHAVTIAVGSLAERR